MSDDIKARLRYHADQLRRELGLDDPPFHEANDMDEAADCIEALEAENARLRNALEPFRGAPVAPGDQNWSIVKCDDILRARAALDQKG